MNDTPGWASPGSAPSDGQEPAANRAESAQNANRAQTPPATPAVPEQQQGEHTTTPPADSAPTHAPGPQWSKNQPPAGQWTAPTGRPADSPAPQQPQGPTPPPPAAPGWNTPPGGYGAPGAQHGWGHAPWGPVWAGPPPAAKPGVIPLRPLGVGEILDGAVSTMRAHWRTVLGISLAVAVVVEIITVLIQGLLLDSSTAALGDPKASLDEQTRALGSSLSASSIVYLVSVLGMFLASALLTPVISRAVLGKPVTTGGAWREARTQLPRLAGLVLLLILGVVAVIAVGAAPGLLLALAGAGDAAVALAGFGMLGASVVAVWLWYRYSLAAPTLMLEKQGVKKALTRSAKLVRGSWWRVFGIQLLALFIANFLSAMVVVPFALAGAALGEGGMTGFATNASAAYGWPFLIVSGIGAVIGYMITFPVTAGVSVLLYIDQRIRREALDLELARAAGLQDDHAATGS